MHETGSLVAPDGYTLGPCVGGLAGRTLVFAGVDDVGTPCCLKTLDPAAAGNRLREARFAAECAAHIRANGCPHVLPLHDSGTDGWIITSWANDGALDLYIERARQLASHKQIDSAAKTLHVVTSLLKACEALHYREIVHRDIKPSNILLNGEAVWLADFGLAAIKRSDGNWRALPDGWVETEIGSPDWAPPELQRSPPDSDCANDVFGIARVWEALVALGNEESSDHRKLRQRMLNDIPTQRPSIRELLAHVG